MPEYHGPMSLVEALAVADRQSGLAVAVSVPGGDLIAVQRGSRVQIRRTCRVSGHGGSVVGSGEWAGVEDVAPSVGWRPA